jgi:hypothetical protein
VALRAQPPDRVVGLQSFNRCIAGTIRKRQGELRPDCFAIRDRNLVEIRYLALVRYNGAELFAADDIGEFSKAEFKGFDHPFKSRIVVVAASRRSRFASARRTRASRRWYTTKEDGWEGSFATTSPDGTPLNRVIQVEFDPAAQAFVNPIELRFISHTGQHGHRCPPVTLVGAFSRWGLRARRALAQRPDGPGRRRQQPDHQHEGRPCSGAALRVHPAACNSTGCGSLCVAGEATYVRGFERSEVG